MIIAVAGRLQLKCDGTRWRTRGEVKGKLANGVGSRYPSHYLGTRCIQHHHRRCARLGPPAVNWTDAPHWADLNGLVRFARKTKSGFCACAITFRLASTDILRVVILYQMIVWEGVGPFKECVGGKLVSVCTFGRREKKSFFFFFLVFIAVFVERTTFSFFFFNNYVSLFLFSDWPGKQGVTFALFSLFEIVPRSSQFIFSRLSPTSASVCWFKKFK